MSAGFWVALVGACCIGAFVDAYLLYTLAGWNWLESALGRVRRASMAFGMACVVAGVLHALDVYTVALGVIGILMVGYAIRNQWLFPRPAARLVASECELPGDTVIAVTQSEQAVPLAWLGRKRTVICGDTLVVYCGLSRALSAFDRPENSTSAATLPHETGFYVGDSTHRWDGLTGKSSTKAPDLVGRPIRVMTVAQWQQTCPSGNLLLPAMEATLPTYSHRSPVVRKARGVEGASDWGIVNDGHWSEWNNREAPGPVASQYLARWAALARGITGAEHLDS